MARFTESRHQWRRMNKQVPWDNLLELVGKFTQGASIEEIMLGLNPSFPRRTVQRWLARLVKDGQLIAVGKGRARRYELSPISGVSAEVKPHPIPLSSEAVRIETLVSRPIQARHPIGYNREFLKTYRPNSTYYLPENMRQKLLEMGESKDGNHPAGTYARKIFHRLLIDLSWNSSRLEGNTYSLLETEQLLEWGKAAEGKNLQETQMILNHKAAIEFLIDSAADIEINRYLLLNLHTLLSDNLLSDPDACGRLRSIPVGIAKSVYLPSAIPAVIDECFNLILDKAKQIQDPFEQAFFLMVHLPYLQPFDDVNKRTSRLAANIPLIKHNLSPLSFIDVPEQLYIQGLLAVYELNRVELLRDVFVWAYERSCALYSRARKSLGEPDPLRMRYRNEMQQVIGEIVRHGMDKTQAVAAIRKRASELISANDQPRFIEIIERELQSLHEGNIARFRLSLAEYERWKKSW